MCITDVVLERYGMKWEIGPYQIRNKHGVIVQKLRFDLRDCVLKAQSELRSKRSLFKKPCQDTSAQDKE